MADLSDYLGHVLCEITRARVMADHEAVRVAAEYAADPSGLLRHFPVPRMRLPEIQITIPVAVVQIPDGTKERTNISPERLGEMLSGDLRPVLEKQGFQIDISKISDILRADLDLAKGYLRADLASTLSEQHAAFTSAKPAGMPSPPVRTPPSAPVPPGTPVLPGTPVPPGAPVPADQVAATMIREQIAKTLERVPRRPAGIAVDGTTSAVKEVGNPAATVNLKLVIREESLEMVLAEADQRLARLVPE